MRLLAHGVREDAIDADGGEAKRDQRERRHDGHAESLRLDRLAHDVGERLRVRDRQRRIEPLNRRAQIGEHARRLAVRPDDEIDGSIEEGSARRIGQLEQRLVRLGNGLRSERRLVHVADDADDGHPRRCRCRDAPFDLTPNWILIRPQAVRHQLVDDDDRLADHAAIPKDQAPPVGVGKEAAAFQRDAERFEIVADGPRRGDYTAELRNLAR